MSFFGRLVHAGFAVLCALVIVLAGCGRHRTRANVPPPPARTGTSETGVASWYGVPYHGRRAASGEIFDMNAPTAAHRKLPFQTWVEVTNLSNGKSTDVRINDRGPFVRGRIIDLSQSAARDIDMLRAGTARVRLKVIPPPQELARAQITEHAVPAAGPEAAQPSGDEPPADPSATALSDPLPPVIPQPAALQAPHPDWYSVQAGAFSDASRAEAFRQAMEAEFMDARAFAGERGVWRVFVGREMTREQANQLVLRVRKEVPDAVVVREPESPSSEPPTTPK